MEEKLKARFFPLIFNEGHFLQKRLVGNFHINATQKLSALTGT